MMENVKKRKISASAQEAIWGYVFLLPWILGMILFVGGPIIASLILAFCDWDLIQAPKFVGLDNFVKMFTTDKRFWTSLGNTFYYTVFAVPLGIIGSVIVALLMNQKWKTVRLLRTIYYLPSVTAGVASSIIWMWLLNPDFGLINYALGMIGIKGPQWMADTAWSKPALIIMSLWGVGGNMIIYLAGLQGIPRQLYEAAEIDGAGMFHKLRYVTLPMLTPVIFFNLIMSIVWSFQVFTQVYVMTGGQGGPADSTLVLVLYIYQHAFKFHNMGYASALAWVLFVIIMIFTLLQFKFAGGWVHYEGELKK
ncbi:MAG TPA: sugar ABC transporter permease [Candidatus Goldiibacteriota bacterium]|nr:sugar ABC transporter permease [Candidatus Goldiibacteriota bacterium]